jgi:ethanolamine-phosphate cytidylyltransferase
VQDLDATKGDKNGQVSIYMDGVFDLMHLGHYNAIRQCSLLGDYLVAGVNSDADCLKTKGPTIMKIDERCEILKHCKFVENIEPNTVYTPTFELLDKVGCDYYAHGDDPTFDSEGVDITQKFKEADRFKVFKRTEGVSTTDVTGRLLALA